MDFLIASAYAQDGGAAGQGGLLSFLPLIVIFIVFYFLLIRPQMKRAKEHKALVAQLSVGDEVVTNGGLLGKVTNVGDSFVSLELSENVKIKLQKHAVASVMPKGTIKSA
ncbi:MAG TPA: preprotein translocase subunit YajC [Xanthomonadales bacterium]|nr:preprotein translocase subunit YajC [Xanthomonadales bacterium]